MAKVGGPLMSLEASGSVAGALTFAKWKGRQYVRQLVIPANPQSASQESARNAMRVSAAAQRWANLSTNIGPSRSVTDKAAIQAVTPAGEAWNGYLTRKMIGPGAVTFDAAVAAYAALSAGAKTAWDTAAAGLTPPIGATAQTSAGGVPATAITSGGTFFVYEYGLAAILGLANPGATPPVYA